MNSSRIAWTFGSRFYIHASASYSASSLSRMLQRSLSPMFQECKSAELNSEDDAKETQYCETPTGIDDMTELDTISVHAKCKLYEVRLLRHEI